MKGGKKKSSEWHVQKVCVYHKHFFSDLSQESGDEEGEGEDERDSSSESSSSDSSDDGTSDI